MQVWQWLKSASRNLTRKQAVETDLEAEIRSYQQMLLDEKVRGGTDLQVARRETLLELGGSEQVKEAVRDVRMGTTLEAIGAELRQSLRGLQRNPGLTALGAAMLALGMGASTVVFSIFYAALVQPLPFRDAERVVELTESRKARGLDQVAFSEANFWDVRAQNHSFQEVAAYHDDEVNLTGSGTPEKVKAVSITAGFLRTLGVTPVLGRDFAYEEVQGGYDNRVVILGNRFWKRRFGGDPNILGTTLRVNERACTVIGVLPPGEPWIHHELYLPFGYRPNANRGSWEFSVIGRLAHGASIQTAGADLESIAGNLASLYPRDDLGIGFRIEPSSSWVAGDSTRSALQVLLAAVTFLLLIACLNITNLLLARGMARQREIAVRTALGAGRGRLIRFVMMESLLLSGFGAALGLVLAYAALHAIQAAPIQGIPRLDDATLNPWVLAYAGLIAVLTGVLSGLAPALQAPAHHIATTLRDGDRQTGGRRQGRLRSVLVTGEVALSFLLLIGAGLLIRSFTQLANVNPGFQTEKRLWFSVSMPGSYYEKGTGKQFLDRLFERLSTIPGVVAAGAVSHRPVEGGDPGMGIDSVSGQRDPGQRKSPWAAWRVVSPGYFRAAGLPLLRGRLFEESDQPVWAVRGQPVPLRHVVINQRLAKLIFPNEDAVGKHALLWKGQSNLDAEVVGIVGDSLERGLASTTGLTVYLPYGSNALVGEFVVHTSGNPLAIIPTVHSIIAGLDPNLPVSDVRSFEEVMHRSVAPQRFNAILLGVFSGLALLLAMTGLYGVLSYSMSRRTSEIGLRVALGASSRSILGMTLGQGMRPVIVGVLLGALGSSWLSRYFATLLFGIKPFDIPTYAAVSALLLGTALVACYLPGRRAANIDPEVALRIE
jgi:putative ABC transport system permease protein